LFPDSVTTEMEKLCPVNIGLKRRGGPPPWRRAMPWRSMPSTLLNPPPTSTPPSGCRRHRIHHRIGSGAGVKAGVQSAVRIQSSYVIARRAIHLGEKAAQEHFGI